MGPPTCPRLRGDGDDRHGAGVRRRGAPSRRFPPGGELGDDGDDSGHDDMPLKRFKRQRRDEDDDDNEVAETPKKSALDRIMSASSADLSPKELVEAKADMQKIVDRAIEEQNANKSIRMKLNMHRKRLDSEMLAKLDRDPSEALKDIDSKLEVLRKTAENLQQASHCGALGLGS